MHPAIWAERSPDKPAIVLGDEQLTYDQLDIRIRRLIDFMRADAGLSAGDHIAICAGNRLDYLVVTWAAQFARLYWTTVNSRLTPDEAAHIVNDCGAAALFCSTEAADLAAALVQLTPGVRRRLVIDGELARHESLDAALLGRRAVPLDGREGQPMLYSSGSTGRPKGILRPLDPHPVTEAAAGGWLREVLEQHVGVDETSTFLVPAPLYHTAPVMWSMAAHRLGATVVLMECFDPEELLRTIERERVTHVYLVPTMMEALRRLPLDLRARHDVSSLRGMLHAAAPCRPALKQAMIDWFGPIVIEVYGMTEGLGWTTIDSHEAQRYPGSVGRPRNCELHVLDERGRELPAGEVGTIWFSAPGGGPLPNRIEYHGDPDKTAELYDARGWGSVGDLGYVRDGYLFLTGRASGVIISGGVNISPCEIEQALLGHPAVADVAVVGVPDELWGEAVHAIVEPVASSDELCSDAAALIAHCRSRLAPYKCPKAVTFVEALPRDGSGKLRRNELDALIARIVDGEI